MNKAAIKAKEPYFLMTSLNCIGYAKNAIQRCHEKIRLFSFYKAAIKAKEPYFLMTSLNCIFGISNAIQRCHEKIRLFSFYSGFIHFCLKSSVSCIFTSQLPYFKKIRF